MNGLCVVCHEKFLVQVHWQCVNLPKIICEFICFDFGSRHSATSESLQDSRKIASSVWVGGKRCTYTVEVVKGLFKSAKICGIQGQPCAKSATVAPSALNIHTLESCHNVALLLLVGANFEFAKSVTNNMLCTWRAFSGHLQVGMFSRHQDLIGALENNLSHDQQKTDTASTVKTFYDKARTDGNPSWSPKLVAVSTAKYGNGKARTDGKPSRSPPPAPKVVTPHHSKRSFAAGMNRSHKNNCPMLG